MTLRLRRGTDLQRQGIVLAEGELVYVIDTKEIYAGDGSTLGGIKVTGDVLGSPPRLTQNLDLDGYTINGIGAVSITGAVTATAFVGDGSGLTNISTSSGVVPGQEYEISIQGNVRSDSSSILVDASTSTFFGNFVGDGSLISNITLDQLADVNSTGVFDGAVLSWNSGLSQWVPSTDSAGVTEGSNYRINIIGDDSSLIVDTANNRITGNFFGDGSLISNITLNQLADVDSAGAIDGDALVWNAGTGRWVPAVGSGTGVVEGSDYRINIIAADSSILVNTATGRIAGTFVGDGDLITNIDINKIQNVSTFAPATSDILIFETDTWINAPLDLDRIKDVDVAAAVLGDVLFYDGTNWINIPADGLLKLGQDYNISIIGDDSTRIVDTTTGNVTGNFIGDGSLISNLELNQNTDVNILTPLNGQVLQYQSGNWVNTTLSLPNPIVEGSNYRINIAGDDSTIIVDAANGNITANNIAGSRLDLINDAGIATMSVESFQNRGEIYLKRSSNTSILDTVSRGAIFFAKDESGTVTGNSVIQATGIGITIGHNSTEILFDPANYVTWTGQFFGIGTFSPENTLQVNGDTQINDGVLYLKETRALAAITDPVVGYVAYNTDVGTISFHDGIEWKNLVWYDALELATSLPGAVKLEGLDQTTLDGYGQDSVDLTGLFAYNSTKDRFQFFQAGSWVEFPNNGTSAGQVLTWDGAKWEGTAPATGGSVVSADQLDGFDGDYYLNYENHTNTPTISAFGATLIDDADAATARSTLGLGTAATTAATAYATAAQGTLADSAVQPADLGSFTFTSSTLDTSDSSGIVVTPAVTFSSDVTVENDLVVTNKITVDTLEVANLITSPGAGTPEIESDGAILLTAGTRVEISSSPLKMASFTTAERDGLSAENGDMIYNTTTNKFQGYANGTWVDLH